RSYTTGMQAVMPQFLATSFDMLRDSQSKMGENLSPIPTAMTSMPGFDALRKQQEAFLKTVMGGMPGWSAATTAPEAQPGEEKNEDLADIRKQLAELQAKLSKL